MSSEQNSWQEWLHVSIGDNELLQLPESLLDRTWNPRAADRRSAWILATELRTRITTQPLHYLDGGEEDALTSIYQLFGQIRGLVKDENLDGATHFSELSIYFLNRIVRPFTAKWYTLQLSGHLKNQDVRNEFRQDLKELQPAFQQFADLMVRLSEQAPGELGEFDYTPKREPYPLGSAISFPTQDLYLASTKEFMYKDSLEFNDVLVAEKDDVKTRREAAAISNNADSDPENLVGLSLSGGGIRSATLALGILQSLGKTGVLRYVDYLSTVSGGGYLGTLLSCYLDNATTDNSENVSTKWGLSRDSDPLGENSDTTLMVGHLRNNSRYLLSGGLHTAIWQLLYGIAIQMLLVFSVCVAFAAALRATYLTLDYPFKLLHKLDLPFHLSLEIIDLKLIGIVIGASVIATTLLMIALLPLIQTNVKQKRKDDVLTTGKSKSPNWERRTLVLCMLSAFIFVFYVLQIFYCQLLTADAVGDWIKYLLIAQIMVPVAIGIAGFLIRLFYKSGTFLFRLGFLSTTVIFASLLLLITLDVLFGGTKSEIYTSIGPLWIVFTAILVGIAILFLNINDMTLHRFYKNRLAIAYLNKTDNKNTKIVSDAEKYLSEMRSTNKALPCHLINTALNGKTPEQKGANRSALNRRGVEFFMFSQRHVGSKTTGYWKTTDVEAYDNKMSLATAMAISGAAVAPNMGTNSLSVARRVLAAANVRLNYWFRVPHDVEDEQFIPFIRRMLTQPSSRSKTTSTDSQFKNQSASHTQTRGNQFKQSVDLIRRNMTAHADDNPSLWNLTREYFGEIPVNGKFLNLSDGGHVENLGVYELLRRKCKFIIAIDGEADSAMTRSAVSKIVRFARQDFNTDVRIDTSQMALDDQGFSRSHFTLGEIDYGMTGRDIGFILYIKSSLSGNEPDDVLDYRRRLPEFPHQSTADQFFNEEQFEAYKALGQHIGNEVLAMENIGGRSEDIDKEDLNINALFQNLADNLLRR